VSKDFAVSKDFRPIKADKSYVITSLLEIGNHKKKRGSIMKNIIKILGIIALVAVIGLVVTGCGEKEKSSGKVDSKLVGTWKGDDENGTLIIDKDGGFSGDKGNAQNLAAQIATFRLQVVAGGSLKISGNKVELETNGYKATIYTYKIDGSTLTFYDGEDGNKVVFTGTK